MTYSTADADLPVAQHQPMITRRALLGAAVVVGVLGPLLGAGAGTSAAAGAQECDPELEECESYDIPDGVGSDAWW